MVSNLFKFIVVLCWGVFLTNYSHVGKDRVDTTPTRWTQVVPDIEARPRHLRNLSKGILTKQLKEVDEVVTAYRQTLDEDVGEVKVGGFGKILGEHVFGAQGILEDIHESRRGGRGQSGDEEYLDDLEPKVGFLGKELDEN